jgi:prophage antirepressor-like protein
MNELQIFKNEQFGEIRWIKIDNKDYAVGIDVAKALGYKNPNDAISRHCKGYVKHVVPTKSGEQQMNVIPEGDIYRLTAKSELPGAEKFEAWIFDEVVPSIRKNGMYAVPQLSKELQAIFALDGKQQKLEHEVKDLKDNMPLFNIDCEELQKEVRKMGIKVLGGKDSPAYKDKSIRTKVYSDIQHQIKRQFGLNSYKAIKRSQLDIAIEIIEKYEVPFVLKDEINLANSQMAM